MERWKVLYSGEVQGVGFRYTARSIAGREGIAGFVRNLADGRVELVLEGSPAAISRVLDAVAAEMARHIESTSREPLPPTGQAGFEIR